MRVLDRPSAAAIARLADRDAARSPAVERTVGRIVTDVRRRGDAAVEAWRSRLDGNQGPLAVTAREIRDGWAATPRAVRAAIRLAVRHVRRVAEEQVPRPFVVYPVKGVRIEQRVTPLGRVGCYVPGGRYPLPSTLVMAAVSARVAGVSEIVVACPRRSPAVFCAALEAGATEVWAVGGAQAIAALAYGTASIRRVDKIVGPGNAWVAAAKAVVASDCAVDFHAGPSEIVVWSATGRAAWIAADLVAQAEHDPAARALFVTTNRGLARRVAAFVAETVGPRHPARAALERNGAIVVVGSRDEARRVVNAIAPEHLVVDRRADAADVTAGTVFVGPWSAQAAGDYATGSNHVLPTGGVARVRGGLSAADFVRTWSVQTLTERGIRAIGPAVVSLAGAEGLAAHAASVRMRCDA
jgi:histidinol dehydrogenase